VLTAFFALIMAQSFVDGREINSTTITQSPYNCPISAFSCDLSYLGISSIAPDTFIHHSNLRYLDLNDNQIESLEIGDFNGLSQLLSLNLTNNKISSLEPGDFQGLDTLQSLYLTKNLLTLVKVWIFNDIPSLENLYLGNNLISSIEAWSFDGLSSLLSLHLNDNLLSSLQTLMFKGLFSLSNLYLWTNFITTIESDTFLDLSQLKVLYLANNLITSLEWDDFRGLVSLDWLYMSNNQISSLESEDFSYLSSLKSLYLTNNQIYSLEAGDFVWLPNLRVLYLGKNLFTSLEKSDFTGLSSLAELRLDSNTIVSLEADIFDLSVFPKLSVLNIWNLCIAYSQTWYYWISNTSWSSDHWYCVIIETSSLDDFITALQEKLYTVSDTIYVGERAVNFLNQSNSTFLTNVLMLSVWYTQSFYMGRAEILYPVGTHISINWSNFTWVLFWPILLHPTSIKNLSWVVSAVKFWDTLRTVSFDNFVSIKIPVVWKLSWDSVWIYSSPSFGYSWTFHTWATVYSSWGVSYVSFVTNYGGDYAVSDVPYLPVSAIWSKTVIVPNTPWYEKSSEKSSKRAVQFIIDEDVCPSSKDGHCWKIKESLTQDN
jgi:Leucine-rich repeat (LRR) protein